MKPASSLSATLADVLRLSNGQGTALNALLALLLADRGKPRSIQKAISYQQTGDKKFVD